LFKKQSNLQTFLKRPFTELKVRVPWYEFDLNVYWSNLSIRGPHAATINGRTYHKTHDQSSSNPSSGLGYIFFDNLQKLNENSEKFEDLRQDILQRIYEDLKLNNSIAQEVSNLGKWKSPNEYLKYVK